MKSPDNAVRKENIPLNINTNIEVMEFMSTRRSVPAKFMSGPGPDRQQLDLILNIACRVPDHGKITPWRFIHYGREKCVGLGEKILARAVERAAEKELVLNEEKTAIERSRFLRAPVVIAVVSCAGEHAKVPEWEQVLSSGAVAMNMLIAVNASGYDAQWLTEWCAYDDHLREDFGLKDGERITAFVHMGTRQNPKTERDRPELEDLYTYIGN